MISALTGSLSCQYRVDVRCAIATTDDQVDADSSALLSSRLEKQLADIDRAEKRHRQHLLQQKQFHKKMMQEAVGKLYSDKREVPLPSVADSDSDTPQGSSSPLSSRVAGWAMSIQLPAFLQLAVVMITGFFSRMLQKQQAKVKEL